MLYMTAMRLEPGKARWSVHISYRTTPRDLEEEQEGGWGEEETQNFSCDAALDCDVIVWTELSSPDVRLGIVAALFESLRRHVVRCPRECTGHLGGAQQ